jgi:peptidoglycan/LPS O-acetylase OafA/YrhL
MAMPYADLFSWWIASITFNIMFVIGASIYLYRRGRQRGLETPKGKGRIGRVVKEFAFVWLLLGLWLLYIYSIGEQSALIFAAGNIVMEILLVIYVVRNGDSPRDNRKSYF